jgi:hypothetical protein
MWSRIRGHPLSQTGRCSNRWLDAECHMRANGMVSCVRECWLFLRWNWVHSVLLVPAAAVYTLAHEASHALAVLLQGGDVTEFVWLPSGQKWGHVRYVFPQDVPYSAFLISVAPYIMSVLLCATACAIGFVRRSLKPWVASTVFIWLFLVPLGDLAYAVLPYVVLGSNNDLHHAVIQPSPDGPTSPWACWH